MKKYEYLVLFLTIRNNKFFHQLLSNNFFTYSYLFKNFKKVYIIDLNNLAFLNKKNNINPNILNNFFSNSNVKFVSLNKFIHLHEFLKSKKIIAIKGFKIGSQEIMINIFLKFYDVRLLQIYNVGNRNHSYNVSPSRTKLFKNFLIKKLAHKLTVFLSTVGLVGKIDIRFTANPDYIRFNKTKIANKVANFFNFPYVKKFIPINSRAYDISLNNKFRIKNDYIAVLDEQLNAPQWTKWRNKIKKQDVKLHYKKFNLYLKKLSKVLKKKVIICIHPDDNLNEKKKIFKDFIVKKYRTREYIYKSFLVVFFESSAIIDAILLNKNIITIKSKVMDGNQIATGLDWVKEINIAMCTIDHIETLNLTKDYLIKKKIIKKSKRIKLDYRNYTKNYICTDVKNVMGVEKIQKTIKQIYRLD